MKYAVVEFLCDNSCSVIQESWLTTDRSKCYFPSINSFHKLIQKEIKREKVEKWVQYDIKIIKNNIGEYNLKLLII